MSGRLDKTKLRGVIKNHFQKGSTQCRTIYLLRLIVRYLSCKLIHLLANGFYATYNNGRYIPHS